MKTVKTTFAILIIAALTMSFVNPSEWYLFEEAGCTILFPDKPDRQVQTLNTEIGDLEMNINMYDASKGGDDDNLVYGFITTEYPDSLINSDNKSMIKEFFKSANEGAVKKVQGKLLSEKSISISGYPGSEVRIDFKKGMAIITMRSYLVKNKMYVLQTICVPKKEKNASASKFFGSFKLKS